MIAGSLLFMVAGFIFLVLGRGPDPNVFQFLSIASSLVAGTLLVVGYLRERKKRPVPAHTGEKSEEEASAGTKAGTPGLSDVEADLKALEDGSDEDELQPAGIPESEPLVTSRARAKGRGKMDARKSEKSPDLQPALAGAGPGPSRGDQPVAMSSTGGGGGGGVSGEAGAAAGNDMRQGGESGESKEPSSGGDTGTSSANQQWASLISDVDKQKFEPPAYEKSKSKTESPQQGADPKGDSREVTDTMEQPVATAPKEEASMKPEKPRRGFFGLFKRKAEKAPAGQAAGGTAQTAATPDSPAPASQRSGTASSPAEVSPQSVAEEMSAAREDVAGKVSEEPEATDADTRPETAPIGQAMETLEPNVTAASGRAPRAKPGAKRKTAGRAKTPAKTKARGAAKSASAKAPAKAKAAVKPKTAAKPKAVRGTAKTAKTARTAKTAAKPKTSARRKPGGTGSTP